MATQALPNVVPTVNIIFYQDKNNDRDKLTVNGKVICDGAPYNEHTEERVDTLKETFTALNIPFAFKKKPWNSEEE